MWKGGRQHGEGIFITPQGDQRKGIWQEGKRIKWLDDGEEDQNAQQEGM